MKEGWIHVKPIRTHGRNITREICPDCKKKSYFVNFFEEWYGWDSTCMKCGRTWQDGEWIPLEFRRDSRERNKKYARARWKRGLDKISY